MRVTFSQIKSSRVPQVLGICSTDSRLAAYVNEAQERLIKRGNWWGTYAKYRICADNGCITWPRQIASILSVAVCDEPYAIRNEWFEFLEEGLGLRDGDSTCDGQLFDRGTVCTFNDITGTDKKIKVYADVAESASSKILLLGYDENANWIRTQSGGSWIDGEWVAISTTPVTSTNYFTALTGAVKPTTNGMVRLYEYDTSSATQRAIAVYEPDEKTPAYRRSLIPSITGTSCSGDDDCAKQTVTVMAKLEYIPVANDDDFLLIGNVPAIKDMCMAIKAQESGEAEAAMRYELSAMRELESELNHYLGDGVKQQLKVEGQIFGAGNIQLVY